MADTFREVPATMKPTTDPAAIWAKVDRNGPIPEYRPDLGPCWLWTAGTNGGYGITSWEKRVQKAHRVCYSLVRGPIPEGLVLDHLCRVTICVNPAHLEPVTRGENVHRGNVALGRGVHGTRYRYLRGCRCEPCRTVGNAYSREYKRRRRAMGLPA